jgi:hypothetical protein
MTMKNKEINDNEEKPATHLIINMKKIKQPK